jgi:pyochelin synthetase
MSVDGAIVPPERLRYVMGEAAGAALAGADLTRSAAFADELDAAALLAMARVLRRHGLFRRDGDRHGTEDVLDAVKVAPRHRRIVRRWLAALVREGMLTLADDGRFTGLAAADSAALERAAQRVREAGRALGHGPEMARFLLDAIGHLPELLRDEIALQALLFPDGTMDTADSTYRENTVSRYVNAMAAAALREAAAQRERRGPLRVLEVGAGVGGTTIDMVPALAPHAERTEDGTPGVEYLFTDVSRFFLVSGRERLGDHPWIRYRLFDVNREAAEQGYEAGSADVIVCANVLHNARHIGRVLSGLRRLLTPGGLLLVIETGREHYQIMTSMEFLMSPGPDDPDRDFEDFRRGLDRIFLTRAEWLRELAAAGFGPTVCLPGPDGPPARLGQYVFAATASA